ncbi:lipopolysaccharide biosynthesis protein [Qipengyuania spongiae]|uniref:Lipopolysaccharide biosynthesis protein n=1 Tax=Qipengyuania spongiae TaxID=2909673 RepID=A0ABY5T3J7_9SPHN|nr:lipopolysaccharide biosynthesis protein [Qipengyuania spongiae]UVI39559.1 lipopolysaccharide biosynthesis protein [Qipengyuania spongiae]
MTGTKKLLLKGAGWMALARAVVNAIAFVSTLVLARILVPEDFGLVAIAEAFAVILASLTELSLANALIRHDEPEEHHFHTVWTLNFTRAAILAAAMAALAIPVASLYGDPRLGPILFVLAASTLLSGAENPKLVHFERNLIFRQEFVLNVGAKLLSFIVAITVALLFRSYWALVLGAAAAVVARVTLSYVLIGYRPRPSLAGYRELLSFSIWLTFAEGIQTINNRSVPLAIGFFVSPASLGQYTMGVRLAQMPITQGIAPLRRTLFPAFSRIRHDAARLRAAYGRAQAYLCTVAFPVACGLAVLAEPLVRTLIGEKWLPAVPILQVLSVTAALEIMENTNALAMALDRTKDLFMRNLRVFFVRIPLIVAGALAGDRIGIGIVMGVVIGRSAASVLNMVWNMQLVRSAIAVPLRAQLARGLRPAIASIVMVGCVWAMVGLGPALSEGAEAVAWLSIFAACGAAIYALALGSVWLVAGKPDGPESEVIALVGGLIRKRRERRL